MNRLNLTSEYRGWTIAYQLNAPVTGKWRAEWMGVTMSAGTKEALKSMIDQRAKDRADERAAAGLK
jgi:hypothetical protein